MIWEALIKRIGKPVFVVRSDQSILHGRLIGTRRLCAVVKDGRGVCRLFHPRWVFIDHDIFGECPR